MALSRRAEQLIRHLQATEAGRSPAPPAPIGHALTLARTEIINADLAYKSGNGVRLTPKGTAHDA